MENCTHKIYALKDPTNLEIRYIGVTTQKLSQRLSNHVYYSKKRNCTHVHNWILNLIKNGKYPVIEQIDCANKDNWENVEKKWIASIENLTNLHEGGKGVVKDKSLSSRERSALAHQVPIVQLDLNGKIVAVHESVTAAAKKLNTTHTNIGNVLAKRAKSAVKFKWVYKRDYDMGNVDNTIMTANGLGYKKKVERLNLEDNTVTFYDSLTKAAKANNIHLNKLSFFILQQLPFCIFKFSYKDE
jgi:hypothetical protein